MEREMVETHQSCQQRHIVHQKNDRKAHFDPGHNQINSFFPRLSQFQFYLSVGYFTSSTFFQHKQNIEENKEARNSVRFGYAAGKSNRIETLFIVSFEQFAHLHTVSISLAALPVPCPFSFIVYRRLNAWQGKDAALCKVSAVECCTASVPTHIVAYSVT